MIKNIIFDFDGVILDSLAIREYGFRKIFEEYEPAIVDQLIAYHNTNGGLSRFIKIRYFYETLLHTTTTEETINNLATQFSQIMREQLINQDYLIEDTLHFIKQNHHKYPMYIASGSEQNELVFLNQALGIAHYFDSILGSPTPKTNLVANILQNNCLLAEETILIGDSINDYEAAYENGVAFFGYNNEQLKALGKGYIKNFKHFSMETI